MKVTFDGQVRYWVSRNKYPYKEDGSDLLECRISLSEERPYGADDAVLVLTLDIGQTFDLTPRDLVPAQVEAIKESMTKKKLRYLNEMKKLEDAIANLLCIEDMTE